MYRVSSPLGALQECGALPKGQEAPFGNPVQKRGAQGIRHPGGLLTRAIRALALRAPMASKSAPGGFVFGYFSLDKHKFAWSEFEQPIGWPEGRKPRMVFVAKVSRLSGRDPTLK